MKVDLLNDYLDTELINCLQISDLHGYVDETHVLVELK